MKKSFKKKFAGSRLARAGHVESMGGENLTKRVDAQKVEGKSRRVTPKLGWGLHYTLLRKSGKRMEKRATVLNLEYLHNVVKSQFVARETL